MLGSLVLAAEDKFWILDPLYGALGSLLAGFYAVVPSYAFGIILLTIFVRMLILPLTAKQARSQQAMQRIQPEMKKLQAKHKDDRQKLNEEMMKLYREHKVNPFATCLPLLLQMPVFIVLYRLIIDLNHQPDPKHLPRDSALFESLKEAGGKMVSWGIDLAQRATEVSGFTDRFPYLFLIAIVVATGYYQQRQIAARAPAGSVNPQMQMITKVFPIVFGVISFTVPAGVVLYFAVSGFWQIGQQAWIFRRRDAAEASAKGDGATEKPVKKTKALAAEDDGATNVDGKAARSKPAPKPKSKGGGSPPGKSGNRSKPSGGGRGGSGRAQAPGTRSQPRARKGNSRKGR